MIEEKIILMEVCDAMSGDIIEGELIVGNSGATESRRLFSDEDHAEVLEEIARLTGGKAPDETDKDAKPFSDIYVDWKVWKPEKETGNA